MDHRLIEDENIAELYVTGRLSPEDEEAFESHLLDCSECRSGVALADDLRGSIRTIAAEDAARTAAQMGVLAWLARRTRSSRAGLMMAALLVVAALPVWLQADRMRLARELDEARTSAERPTTASPQAPIPAAPSQTGNEEMERLAQELTQEKTRLEEELRQARTSETKLNEQLAQVTGPQVNTPIVSLGVVRGESDTNDVELGPSPEWIVLSLELSQVEHDTYRATLLDSKGRTVWQGQGLTPTASDTLNILLYSERLQPGAAYRFRLEGMEAGGRAVPAGEIGFRAVKG
ncbi:MAG TPA: zf-HC2 domain-containing protein [Thermoanaerobaculia bacterium]|nr:zf-HC2 domain-containing protein [Thermoanaerobaculia bacterium]